MQNLGSFRYLQPCFFSGLLDDPVLYIHVRPTGRGLLFDCGQIHHLAKRVLRSIDAIFISHAHMDHLMGFDQLLRHVHVASRSVAIYGPAGIADRIHHKLSGYDWNLTEESWCNFIVYEITPHRIEQFEFAGHRGFTSERIKAFPRQDLIIYQTEHVAVEAMICDHKIPVLIFRITEAKSFRIDRQRMLKENLLPGPWLKDLQKSFSHNQSEIRSIKVMYKTTEGKHLEKTWNAEEIYRKVCREIPPKSIGYISDIGMTSENLNRISKLMTGVTLLVSECTFLAEDSAKARISSHLCTSDLMRISERIKPNLLLPMHLSKSYIKYTNRLYEELDLSPEIKLLKLPDYITPRPLLPSELPSLISQA